MRRTAITGLAAAAVALSVVLAGCGSDTKTSTASSSTSTTGATATSSKTATPTPKVAPRTQQNAAGPNPTISTYIQQNGIVETPVKRGDPGSPTINLPFPDGWQNAGADTPDWAYGAIVYTGPEAAEYTPSIVAIVSKLTGNVDPQKIIDLAPGELNNLPGYKAMNDGAVSTLGDYPAYQLGGTWVQDGQTKIVAQKTVVIPGSDGLYVLQLNADGLQKQGDIVSAGTDAIDAQTTITP
jgi:outer membrane murein-binding lipoprotein Lpp